MPSGEDRFLKRYHKAFVMAVKDQLEKVKPKIASDWVRDWMKDLGGAVRDEEEFRRRFGEFLEELGFAEGTAVSINDDGLDIKVEGCRICEGNELLRREGEPTLCPIIPTGLQAVSRVLGKNARLLEVEKDGRVGFCTIKYRISGKNRRG